MSASVRLPTWVGMAVEDEVARGLRAAHEEGRRAGWAEAITLVDGLPHDFFAWEAAERLADQAPKEEE